MTTLYYMNLIAAILMFLGLGALLVSLMIKCPDIDTQLSIGYIHYELKNNFSSPVINYIVTDGKEDWSDVEYEATAVGYIPDNEDNNIKFEESIDSFTPKILAQGDELLINYTVHGFVQNPTTYDDLGREHHQLNCDRSTTILSGTTLIEQFDCIILKEINLTIDDLIKKNITIRSIPPSTYFVRFTHKERKSCVIDQKFRLEDYLQ